jgi:hypothetical protein
LVELKAEKKAQFLVRIIGKEDYENWDKPAELFVLESWPCISSSQGQCYHQLHPASPEKDNGCEKKMFG